MSRIGEVIRTRFLRGSSMGETRLGVKKNLTAGYCGRNGGFNMEVSVQGGPGCGERVTRPMTPGDLEMVEI